MRYEIRELEIGGILDQTIRLFRDHFAFVAMVVCIVLIPIQVPFGLVTTWAQPQPLDMTATEAEALGQAIGQLQFAAVSIFGGFLLMLLNAMTQAAVAYGIAHRYLGYQVSAGESIRKAWSKALPLLGAAILYGIGIGFGMLFCIIPGILFMLMWYVLYPVLIFEDSPVMAAFGRSTRLMKGHKGKAFVLTFLLALIGFGVNVIVLFLPGVYLSSILSNVVASFLVGLNSVAATVVYFSARCRTEQFDLELLSQLVEDRGAVEEPVL